MKKIPIFLLMLTLRLFAIAQVQVKVTTEIKEVAGLDSNRVVIDEAGKKVPFKTWSTLVVNGGYQLKTNGHPTDTSTFTLVKMTEAEENRINNILPKPPASPFFTTGEKIKPFNARDINGSKIKLKELEGKIVVLNFWFIKCPPCVQEIPALNKLVTDYSTDPNVVFVSVCLDYKSEIKDFLKNNPFNYQIIDEGRIYADLYKINTYPVHVVLDKEGRVRFHAIGNMRNIPHWIKKTIGEAEK